MKYLGYYVLPILWMVVIFILSSQQRLQVSPVYLIQFTFFKTLHVIEYAFLCVLWIRALRNTTTWSWPTIALTSFVITVVYAFSDELHQQFVPTREGKLRDVAIDTLGALVGIGMVWKLFPQAHSRLKK